MLASIAVQAAVCLSFREIVLFLLRQSDIQIHGEVFCKLVERGYAGNTGRHIWILKHPFEGGFTVDRLSALFVEKPSRHRLHRYNANSCGGCFGDRLFDFRVVILLEINGSQNDVVNASCNGSAEDVRFVRVC